MAFASLDNSAPVNGTAPLIRWLTDDLANSSSEAIRCCVNRFSAATPRTRFAISVTVSVMTITIADISETCKLKSWRVV